MSEHSVAHLSTEGACSLCIVLCWSCCPVVVAVDVAAREIHPRVTGYINVLCGMGGGGGGGAVTFRV